VTEARRTLGAWLAPDGNNEKLYKQLIEQAEDWAEHVRTGHLDKRFVSQSLTSTVMAKLAYPLAATTMDEDDCDDIDRICYVQPFRIAACYQPFQGRLPLRQ
jgi:hypothetical protein